MTAEEAELRTAIDRVITSPSRRKLVVAGPGTGKTSLFKELLYASGAGRDDHLVLTFINTLRNDLEEQRQDSRPFWSSLPNRIDNRSLPTLKNAATSLTLDAMT